MHAPPESKPAEAVADTGGPRRLGPAAAGATVATLQALLASSPRIAQLQASAATLNPRPAHRATAGAADRIRARAGAADEVDSHGIHATRAGEAPPIVQGRFLKRSAAPVPPGQEHPEPEAQQDPADPVPEPLALQTPEAALDELLQAGAEDAEGLRYALRKLAEGPDIVYSSPAELAAVVEQRRALLERGKEGPARQLRKINRIAGQLEQKQRMLDAPPGFAEVNAQLHLLLERVVSQSVDLDSPAVAAPLLTEMADILSTIGDCLAVRPSRFIWQIFDVVSSFGPLAHAVEAVNGGAVAGFAQQIAARLRTIRQLMARNPDGPTIVAHRGAGPTNRTMGGLISDTDNRRVNRPAENSQSAFASAFQSVGLRALDGVECDVYLSADGVPMLSHEGKVQEQLSAAQKLLYPDIDPDTEVHDLSKATLKQVRRKGDDADSGFMTLNKLLNLSVGVAAGYYEATGKAFRVEVEMKGAKVREQVGGRVGPKQMEAAVAKVISGFYKRNPGAPVEIILFNNELADVENYARLRNTKSALGGIHTGLGTNKKDLSDDRFPREYIDELRYQFTVEFDEQTIDQGTIEVAHRYLENFIVTLVFGQEFAPPDLQLGAVEPTEPPLYGRGAKIKPGKLPARDFDMNIQAALEHYAANPDNLSKLRKLHILTDYPTKAAWIKAGLIAASNGALAAIGD